MLLLWWVLQRIQGDGVRVSADLQVLKSQCTNDDRSCYSGGYLSGSRSREMGWFFSPTIDLAESIIHFTVLLLKLYK